VAAPARRLGFGRKRLGIVVEAAKSRSGLNPLLLTDTFVSQGFGLGVCGIGGQVASGSAFWYTKVDHTGLQVGGSQFAIHAASRCSGTWRRTSRLPGWC
jgi:hypothetical protein